MMTSSNGKIFRVTGHLCGEFTGPRWIPRTKASDADGALMFSLICAPINGWVNNGEAGDLRRNHAHYDASVMIYHFFLTHSMNQSQEWIPYTFIYKRLNFVIRQVISSTIACLADMTFMMTSSNGSIFRVTGHLCGEFIGPRWILRTKASDAELWCFLWSVSK